MAETPKYQPGVHYVQNKDGVVFIATPQLVKRSDMTTFIPPGAAPAAPAPVAGVGLTVLPAEPESDRKPLGKLTKTDFNTMKKAVLVGYMTEAGLDFDPGGNYMQLKKQLRSYLGLS
jgi:hypothetical protein